MLDAAKRCCEQWGIAKVTIDDIAAEAGVSRATLYRMFPGGKDVLFEALRVRELEDFFDPARPPRSAGVDRPRGAARAHRRRRHPRAARRRPPRAHAGVRARRHAQPSSPSTACRGSSAWPTLFLAPLVDPYLDPRTRGAAGRPARPPRHLVLPRADRPRRPRRPDIGPRASSRPHPRRRSSPTAAPTEHQEPTMTVTHSSNEDDHRPRRDQRHRGDPVGHQHRRRRGRAHRQGQRRRDLHVGLLAGPPAAAQAVREGQGRPVERHHRPAVGHRGRRRAGRRRRSGGARQSGLDRRPLRRHRRREVGRQGVARVRHREPQLDASASSSTASRARCCAPPRSSRPCRGTTPSCTPRPRWSTRPATSRCSPATSTRSSAAASRSTPTCGCCSTTSSTTAAGT